jgi:hypothetical protein
MRGVAASIAILCLRAAAQEPAREPAPCTIGGTVIDKTSDKPVVRARVLAEVSGKYSFMRLTDERGGFCFERLTPADYQVIVQKTGYTDTLYGVTLAVEENTVVKPLALRMERYGGLSGAVLDAGGELLPGAEVKVWQRLRGKNSGAPDEVDSATADGSGAFRISQLEPGTYYLSVRPADEQERRFAFPFLNSSGQIQREKEVETFYSASFTFADANPVEVKAGQQVDNLLLTLKRARLRRVSGRLVDPPPAGFLYCSGETETGSDTGTAIPIGKDGSFAKVDLLPAKYTCRLSADRRLIAQRDVDLTNGDAVGITLDPIETIDLPVTLRMEGKGPAFRPRTDSAEFMLVRDGSDECVALGTAVDGTYRFASVPRGMYRLRVELAGQKLYLKGMAYGGETLTGDKVDLRMARQGGLEVTFSSNVAELQGRVQPSTGAAEGDESDGVTVILVGRAKDGKGLDIAWQTGIDQKGRFHMGTVPPGKYQVFAIDGFDEDEWGNPDLAKALAAKSVELELKESEKKQVSLPVISAAEWEAAVKKIGG